MNFGVNPSRPVSGRGVAEPINFKKLFQLACLCLELPVAAEKSALGGTHRMGFISRYRLSIKQILSHFKLDKPIGFI